MSVLTVVLIVIIAVACCALCGYAIASAVRRSRTRRYEPDSGVGER